MASSLVMYVVLAVTGVLGSLIAWDDLRRGNAKQRNESKPASADGKS